MMTTETTNTQAEDHQVMKICPICGRGYFGRGNNPDPVLREDQGGCCNDCNNRLVIPVRFYIASLVKAIREEGEYLVPGSIPATGGQDPFQAGRKGA